MPPYDSRDENRKKKKHFRHDRVTFWCRLYLRLSQSVIALLDSTLGDAVIYSGGGGSHGKGGDASSRQNGDLAAFGGIVFPTDEFQFWSG